jgi:hypothetical protein
MAPVFLVEASKEAVLNGMNPDLIRQEKEAITNDQVKGANISVGSLAEATDSGNWPPMYDQAEVETARKAKAEVDRKKKEQAATNEENPVDICRCLTEPGNSEWSKKNSDACRDAISKEIGVENWRKVIMSKNKDISAKFDALAERCTGSKNRNY